MKRRIWIAIAVIVIIAAVAVACIFGYVSGQKEQEPEPPATVEPDGNPAETEDPENPDDTEEPAVQPENPNPSGGESVVVYVPDEEDIIKRGLPQIDHPGVAAQGIFPIMRLSAKAVRHLAGAEYPVEPGADQ